jgi:hypothetical protein
MIEKASKTSTKTKEKDERKKAKSPSKNTMVCFLPAAENNALFLNYKFERSFDCSFIFNGSPYGKPKLRLCSSENINFAELFKQSRRILKTLFNHTIHVLLILTN